MATCRHQELLQAHLLSLCLRPGIGTSPRSLCSGGGCVLVLNTNPVTSVLAEQPRLLEGGRSWPLKTQGPTADREAEREPAPRAPDVPTGKEDAPHVHVHLRSPRLHHGEGAEHAQHANHLRSREHRLCTQNSKQMFIKVQLKYKSVILYASIPRLIFGG